MGEMKGVLGGENKKTWEENKKKSLAVSISYGKAFYCKGVQRSVTSLPRSLHR